MVKKKDSSSQTQTSPIVLIMGMSGAGKSITLRFFEDLGYQAISNLPPRFLKNVIEDRLPQGPLVIQIDHTAKDWDANFALEEIQTLRLLYANAFSLLFLECDIEILAQRYRGTRRTHPLNTTVSKLELLIETERSLLNQFKEAADISLDTSLLTPPELKSFVRGHFSLKNQQAFLIQIVSFSFIKGVPREADFVFDVRFLTNPFYQEELKHLTGEMEPIQEYIYSQDLFHRFFQSISQMMESILPAFKKDSRRSLTLAFGCTGGRHRSVYTAEHMKKWCVTNAFPVTLSHRDIEGALQI